LSVFITHTNKYPYHVSLVQLAGSGKISRGTCVLRCDTEVTVKITNENNANRGHDVHKHYHQT